LDNLGEESQGIEKASTVWESSRYRIGTDLTADVEVPIPPSVRRKRKPLVGWLVMSYVENVEDSINSQCDYNSGECDAVYHNKLTRQEFSMKLKRDEFLRQQQVIVPVEFTQLQRDMALTFSFLFVTSYQSKEVQASQTLYPHFKYLRYPLTVRIVHFGKKNLAVNTIPELRYQFRTHRDKSKIVKDVFYEPITYVDDVTLLKRQCVRISKNISAPNPKIKFRLITTSTAYYGIKLMEENTFRQVEQMNLLGELEQDDLKRMLSDDYVYRYLLTMVISYAHIYLEYLAFRNDFSFLW
jgi:hypothetical protein